MCIIIMKPKNIKMISDEIINNSWLRNPHGAGISIANGKTIITQKGLMKIDDVFDYLDKMEKKYDFKKCAIMLHFRITSKGETTKEQTHPYPIYKRILKNDLSKIAYNSNLVVAHNGTMPFIPIDGMNDTQTFILRNQDLIKQYEDFRKKIKMQKLTQSRLCFLSKKGNYQIVGSFEKKDGVLYSNSSYKGYLEW